MSKNKKRKTKVNVQFSIADLEFISLSLGLYASNYCPEQVHKSWRRDERKAREIHKRIRYDVLPNMGMMR